MIVKFKKLRENATIPQQATELAGGWDVTAANIEKVNDGYFICKLGFALQIPKGYKLTLVPRSSITKTSWVIQNSPGLGDADYLQEYQFRFRCIPRFRNEGYTLPNGNTGFKQTVFYEIFPFKEGDRIGQIYLEEVIPIEFEEVSEFDFTNNRGGYGSTGK